MLRWCESYEDKTWLMTNMQLFCVFSCGHMATYLCKYPNICPDPSYSRDGPVMLQRAMTILTEAAQVWPLAARWLEILDKFFRDNKGILAGIEGSMADGRDPVPEALQAALGLSPTVKNGQGSNQPAAASNESQPNRNGETTAPTVLPAPPSVPTPMMYIDPNMRAQEQGQLSQAQGEVQPQEEQAQAMAGMSQQQQPGARPTTDGLGLLLEAFDTHQGANMAAAGQEQPYDPNAAANQAGYYGQAGAQIPGNDGYENELQFYIDGAPSVQAWVPGGSGMYGY